jgi:uncharacterized protein YfaS (alpha-2-macroglobulin family)
MGLISQNIKGVWENTVANTYSTIALRAFSAVYEKTPVSGTTKISLLDTTREINWLEQKFGGSTKLMWPNKTTEVETVKVNHAGTGAPWALVTTSAAVPLTAPAFSGFNLTKELKPVQQAKANQWSVGDIVEVKLTIKANMVNTQTALLDPIPTGAKIINTGRSSTIESSNNILTNNFYPTYEQLSYESYRAFYEWFPSTDVVIYYQYQLTLITFLRKL